jgi:hypothetical protein
MNREAVRVVTGGFYGQEISIFTRANDASPGGASQDGGAHHAPPGTGIRKIICRGSGGIEIRFPDEE